MEENNSLCSKVKEELHMSPSTLSHESIYSRKNIETVNIIIKEEMYSNCENYSTDKSDEHESKNEHYKHEDEKVVVEDIEKRYISMYTCQFVAVSRFPFPTSSFRFSRLDPHSLIYIFLFPHSYWSLSFFTLWKEPLPNFL